MKNSPAVDSDTRRNILASYVNFILVAVVGFVANPLLLSSLGPVMFGVWKSLQRYLDFASVADGRAVQALKWIIANRIGHSDDELRRDIGAAIVVWFRWLPAIILVGSGITWAVPLLVNGIPSDMRSVAYLAAGILTANAVLAGLLSIPDSALVGVNKGYRSIIITTVFYLASNAGMVAVAFLGWPLWSLAVIVLVAAIGNSLFTLIVAKRTIKWWGVIRPNASDLRRVFSFSSWTLGSAAVDKLFWASELIIISIGAGAAVVTQYTFTAYVTQFVLSITLVTASGFMPALGSQLGAEQVEAAALRAGSVRHLVMGIAVLGCGALLAFNGTFVTLWVGSDNFLGTTLNMLLVICSLQFALIRMDGQILDVTLRIAPKVVFGLISSAGGILAGVIVYKMTKNLAAALCAVIFLRLVCNLGYPEMVRRLIPGSGLPRNAIIIAALFLAACFCIGPLVLHGTWISRIMFVIGWTVVATAVAWIALLPRSTVRQLLMSRGS